MRRGLGLLTAAICIVLSHPVRAEQPNWKEVLNGIDGIVVYCRATTREFYADKICDSVSKTAEKELADTGLPVAANGIVYTGPAARKGEAADLEASRRADGMKRPLLIRLHIKGTDDNHPAIFVELRSAIEFKSATEEGSTGSGISGDLIVHEVQFVANGPRKKLANYLTSHMAKQMKALAGEIKTGL